MSILVLKRKADLIPNAGDPRRELEEPF